jgi:RNA polymerase sigma-70 factor (ECF subfamily)
MTPHVELTAIGSLESPPPAYAEAELLQRIRKGEKELFYELVRPHAKSIYWAAYSILKNGEDAQEVAQESILSAFKHLNGFRSESKFRAWLMRIAVNESRSRYRKMHGWMYEPLDEPNVNEEGTSLSRNFADWRELPPEAVERKEVHAVLSQALAVLPEKHRKVLLMRDVQEMSIAETARALGIRAGAVKTRLFRARRQMRALLAPEMHHWRHRKTFQNSVKPWE